MCKKQWPLTEYKRNNNYISVGVDLLPQSEREASSNKSKSISFFSCNKLKIWNGFGKNSRHRYDRVRDITMATNQESN